MIRPIRRLLARIIGRLLSWCNSRPPFCREEFYALKDQLLRRFGTEDGYDLQHIVKECWNCAGRGPEAREECWKCQGTGIFAENFWQLDRFRLGRFIFHRPGARWDGEIPILEDLQYRSRIEGKIEHRPTPDHLAAEGLFWLALAFDRPLFRYAFGCRVPGWRWYAPLGMLSHGLAWLRRRVYEQVWKWYPDFEVDQGLADCLLIPYWWLRYQICHLVAWAWYRSCYLVLRRAPHAWGERTTPYPVQCQRCLWAGMMRWLLHSYEDDGGGDVVSVYECPRCGSQEVAPRPQHTRLRQLPF